MVEQLVIYFTYIIEQGGYLGAAVLMALESMVVPVSSEMVMPFVGFLVVEGKFSSIGAILATSVGSIIGSLISYGLGYFGGRPIVLKVGRYLLLNRDHLEWTERWFARHGSWTILVSRFIPVVRHLISIPAGMGRMRLLPFCVYTLIGATIWNSFLLWCGYKLRQNWQLVERYTHELDIAAAFGLVVFVTWFIVIHIRRSRVAEATGGKQSAI
ncbi:MAG TPA: DedA family protein [Desulfomonilaceae bacterium]|nr:DedA family protein [Desulfomonilaceae bacterium]